MPAAAASRSEPSRARGARRGGAQAGQASLEYAGVLAVVAAALVLVGAVTGAGGIVNGVVRGLERALCRVTGGDCLATELAACTVRTAETGGHLGVRFTFVKLGGSLSLLREELSDGTVDVTLVDGADVAPTAALGASGGVRLGGARVGGGAITRAELLVRLGRRRVWHRPDPASADRLVADLRVHVAAAAGGHLVPLFGRQAVHGIADVLGFERAPLPAPDVVGVSAGIEGALEADLAGAATLTAGLRASIGGSRDRASGRRTLVLALEGDAAAALGRAAGGASLGGSGGPSVVLTYDRRGVPIELAVGVAGTARGALAAGLPGPGATGGEATRVEISSRLDLRRDANRAVYEDLLGALSPSGADRLPAAVAALAHEVRAAARRDVLRYTTDAVTYGADAEAALGAGIGGAVEVSRTRTRLRDAWTRPAGGAWEQRTDCLDGTAA